jgi:peptidoglycan-associated lipoprotein
MRLKTLSTLLLTAVLAVGVVGCKKKMDRVTPLPGYGGARIGDAQPERLPPGSPTGGEASKGNITESTGIPPSDHDITGRPQDREKYKAQTVYFDFDRANVKASEAAKVQEVANRFKSEPANTDLLVEGHCDERGTEEYNRSLGERRALAVRELLVAAGVPAERVVTLSFGKDKPADPGHNESAWGKNRRAEFILVLPK